MKIPLACTGFVLLACAAPLSAHEFDPGGKIEVSCNAGHSVRMAEITRAVENSHYWAAQRARNEMLGIARDACEKGAEKVTFVPTDDQRYLPERAREVAAAD